MLFLRSLLLPLHRKIAILWILVRVSVSLLSTEGSLALFIVLDFCSLADLMSKKT